MNGDASRFNEIVAILRRNEVGDGDDGQRSVHDLEDDLRRLLLMTRDAMQCDQMILAQAVRSVTTILKTRPTGLAPHYSAAILCNLAQSERGRLSASSCDRWSCVSHRHNCPLSVLLTNICTVSMAPQSIKLREISASALLSFSVQNECQVQIDLVGGVPLLLKILHETADDGDRRVFVAATLWNLIKSPLVLLKLETIHGILKDRLTRELTDVLWTAVEAMQLSVTPTSERGIGGILESDSVENLGIMLAASTSNELLVVLRVENYIGRPRSLTDQYRTKTPLPGRRQTQAPSIVLESRSVNYFDESGGLKSRSCAVCVKAIKLNKKRRKEERLHFLVCAKDGCEQTFHVTCSRWKVLPDERCVRHAAEFYCAACVLHVPGVSYTDFIAENSRHELLITELRFKSIGIQRVIATRVDSDDFSALLDKKTKEVIAVGVKKYRVPLSSQDPEVFVVLVRYLCTSVSAATHQTTPQRTLTTSTESLRIRSDWSVSYEREGASELAVLPGSTVFWPGSFLQDLEASLYTRQSLPLLEAAFLYEFQGERQEDKMFSLGQSPTSTDVDSSVLWSTLHPRRGICMKLLAEQIGRHKQLNELLGQSTQTPVRSSSPLRLLSSNVISPKKTRKKPHVAGRKLNKVVVIT